MSECLLPPDGWRCTRSAGHQGPCAAEPNNHPQSDQAAAIRVELTDESVAHCLKLIFLAKGAAQPLEIFLHTTQAIELEYKLSLAISQLHHRDSRMLLEAAARGPR